MSRSRAAVSKTQAAETASSRKRRRLQPWFEYRDSEERRGARRRLEACYAEGRGRGVSFAGFYGASLAFFLSSLLEPDDGPSLVITATQEEAEELRDELEEFTGKACYFFPPWESLFLADSEPDGEIYHDRLVALKHLHGLSSKGLSFVVAPIHSVIQPVPSLGAISSAAYRIGCGLTIPRDGLAEKLASMNFRHVPLVMRRGEFSVRGDILDLFPFDATHPLRVEYFDDTIESMRWFHVESQRSVSAGDVEECELLLPSKISMFRPCFQAEDPLLIDAFPTGSLVVLTDPDAIRERAQTIFHNLLKGEERDALSEIFFKRLMDRPLVQACSLALPVGTDGQTLSFGTIDRFSSENLDSSMATLSAYVESGGQVVVYCDSQAETRRISEICRDYEIATSEQMDVRVGAVRRGFEAQAIKVAFLTTKEIFRRRAVRRSRRPQFETRVVHSFFDLQEGDLVVHLVHGVGRYSGIRQMKKADVIQEFLEIEFRDSVKVYVPASKIDLVQKYVGSGSYIPRLDKVGGASWNRRKALVEKAVLDFASELLEIQALRQERPGVAYSSDSDWQRQFEASFPFEDTPDQDEATRAVKDDLQSTQPMDRLLCGDVGYGKTEVALRAAFKVVGEDKQVAVLVPTTVLAQQHCRTFRERLAGFPICIEQLSRFRTPKQQRETVAATKAGRVDILIGTHRLLSEDVGFKDLGMVVIDEEQRFGVAHKERLKKMRAMVEVLTMTATPIPRTLHMALLGIRDISSLSTPPEGRSPIQTEIIEFDRVRIREAIIRELNREGQVYFVHNRVQDIGVIRHQLQQIVPEARIEYAHGQMSEHQLENIMVRFLEHEVDVLVSTTIIETGIDIPNVNTIFINECDRYGLADLHQLRGRVGRSRHKAFSYLILPEHRHVNPDAKKRLQAIREFSQLGAGFQIAMRDLEIRGAGNILGSEQSGHIAVVGYELYCRLLEKAVKSVRGQERDKAVDVEVDLNLEAYIPENFIANKNSRLDIYRRLSKMQEIPEVEEMAVEIEDRCGSIPPPVRLLLDVQMFRILASRCGLRSVAYNEESIVLGSTEAMQELLGACPLRVVVLDPRTVALVVNDPTKKFKRARLSDEFVFRTVFEWLRTKRLREFRKQGVESL